MFFFPIGDVFIHSECSFVVIVWQRVLIITLGVCLTVNVMGSPAYGIFVSQLIHYERVCSKYEDFSLQRIYSGLKVTATRILFTETSNYFYEIIWSSYIPFSQI